MRSQRAFRTRRNCSRSTVYRALQGNPLVSVATREKVQAAAGRIGFRLNPMVGEWMAKVRNPETVLSRLPMLYLAGHSRAQYREIHFLRSTWQGARQRARELGFSIEIWHVAQMQQDWERIVKKIRLREIRGVIIARFPPGSRLVDLPWPDISTVGIGFTALHPPIHTLASHGFETMRYAMEELRKIGRAHV